MKRIKPDLLFVSCNGLPIALFRMLFGLLIFWEFARMIIWPEIANYKYFNTIFHFKYPYFEWVKQCPDNILWTIIFVGALLSLVFAIGKLSRWVTPVLFLLYTYIVLIDISYWNNHFYLYILVLFLFIWIPQSFDQIRFKEKTFISRSENWHLKALQYLFVLVLFYGGVSKLSNPDWMTGDACYYLLKIELGKKGVALNDSTHVLFAQIMTWGGIFIDLIGGFLLLYRRTFWFALAIFIPFNLLNAYLFNIGTFPLTMLSALTLFIPIKYYNRWFNKMGWQITSEEKLKPLKKYVITGLSFFFAFQILLPLRHYFIEGNIFWTGEGKLYAWHMMSGATSTNAAKFVVLAYPPGKKELQQFDIDLDLYINKQQKRTMSKFPQTVPQFATFIEREMKLEGYKNIEVYADLYLAKNGKVLKPVIDPYQDLTKVKVQYWKHNPWILLYLDEGM